MNNLFKKIVFIVGPDKSGKTTLQEELINSWLMKRVISTTTRPPREGEVDGVDYNFLGVEDFHQKDRVQTFNYGGNFYGTTVESYQEDFSGQVGVFVCTPEGVNDTIYALRDKFPESDIEYKIIFLNPSKELLDKRGRDERTSRGNIQEKFNEMNERGDFKNTVKDILVLGDLEISGEDISLAVLAEDVVMKWI